MGWGCEMRRDEPVCNQALSACGFGLAGIGFDFFALCGGPTWISADGVEVVEAGAVVKAEECFGVFERETCGGEGGDDRIGEWW